VAAFGTASAAALGPADTLYGLTPLYHPSGLLTAIGGAVAGGARLAMATTFDPTTFWDETRRYGVTVVSYTWTLVDGLVNEPSHPLEAGHPIRLFVGSGMPTGLWRRVTERFAPARVLELYASTEAEAVLVNVTGEKVGAKGRPLPGTAPVRLAVYDATADRLVDGPDGFAVRCPPGQVGMLLVHGRADGGTSLRSVFRPDDAWVPTGDLFRRDEDGDYWLVDEVRGLVHTASGPVSTIPIEDALSTLDAVDLAAVYGVAEPGGEEVVAAVTLQPGRSLDAPALSVLSELDPPSRPLAVRVVADLPRTTWFRLRKDVLRAQGLSDPTDLAVWRRDPATGRYQLALEQGPDRVG
jgi:putative long chain acyl-CoA synthase